MALITSTKIMVVKILVVYIFEAYGTPRVLDVYQSYPSSRDNQVEYNYRYAIDDGLSSGVISDRWEHRFGEFVKGAYSLLEPGGKIRTVNYEVDGKRGFRATVHTSYPANVLLSNQQLENFKLLYPEPDVNIDTRTTRPLIDRFTSKDPNLVPPNYHAILAEHRHDHHQSQQRLQSGALNSFPNHITSATNLLPERVPTHFRFSRGELNPGFQNRPSSPTTTNYNMWKNVHSV